MLLQILSVYKKQIQEVSIAIHTRRLICKSLLGKELKCTEEKPWYSSPVHNMTSQTLTTSGASLAVESKLSKNNYKNASTQSITEYVYDV